MLRSTLPAVLALALLATGARAQIQSIDQTIFGMD